MFTIGIIGRPNVGKSTLFNRIAGRRIAIVDDMPGVTRDRIEVLADWEGRIFRMVDTAGYDLKEDVVKKEMLAQFHASLREADFFIVVVDAQEGVHPLDDTVVRILREQEKPFILAVNKCENEKTELMANDFYSLGVDRFFTISASHGLNLTPLLDEIIARMPDEDHEAPLPGIKVAVVGRPNVGKSSIINSWLGEERLIVTPIPGTTRDSIDTHFVLNGEDFTLIDTAGIRKKSVMFKDKIEKYGYYRSMDAIKRADICVALIDGIEGVTERDVKVIADAWEAGRPVVLVVNKWDAVEKDAKTANKFKEDIAEKLQFLNNPPVIFASALTGKNVFKVFEAVKGLYAEYTRRIKTWQVNEALREALERHQPPVLRNNRRLKFYYMTQVAACPPTFVTFVNFPDSVHFSYSRFIVNVMREKFGFDGVPVILNIRKRGEKAEYEAERIVHSKHADEDVEIDLSDDTDDDFPEGEE